MAGGIDWFRWHHGTVTDQKLPLVARRAGASVAEVIAVWACLLERASMNEAERGWLGERPDFEAMDCALGLPDGRASAIFDALVQRDMVDEHLQVTAWPKRQPQREDETAAERKRRQREREHEIKLAASVTDKESREVTPKSREVTRGHDRGEESRGDISLPPPNGGGRPADAEPDPPPKGYAVPDCPHQAIVDAYHEVLPTLRRVEVWNDSRAGLLRSRWREVCSAERYTQEQGVAWFRDYFGTVAQSEFLTGRARPKPGAPPFQADLEWLIGPKNFAKVIEGKYAPQ